MNVIIIIGMIFLGVCAGFAAKKLIEGIINLSVLLKKGNRFDVSRQKNGIVYNKKEKKLEADQSMILPF